MFFVGFPADLVLNWGYEEWEYEEVPICIVFRVLVDFERRCQNVVGIGVVAMQVHSLPQVLAFSYVELATMWADDAVD